MNDVDPFLDWDAAYVLGQLSPEDRRSFERHLRTCPACTTAVAELAGMPGLLSLISADEAIALTSAPDDEHLRGEKHDVDLVQKLARSVGKRRRRVRNGIIGIVVGAAAVFAVVGIVIGTSLTPARTPIADPQPSSSSAPVAPVVAMTPVTPGTMTATLQVTPKAWGTRLDWNCSYLSGNEWGSSDGTAPRYSLVVTDTTGEETTVATWSAAGDAAHGLGASTSVPTVKIASVDIRQTGGTPLVRTEL